MSAWGAKPAAGAWASAVEDEEKELGSIKAPVVKENDFPSLGAAVTVKETKKDRKKKQTMSLADFVNGPSGGRGPMTDDSILLNLPSGPRRDRDPDEAGAGIGGGFREYGGGRFGGRGGGDRYGDRDGDRERRPRRGDDDEEGGMDAGPSRADESASWGADRKFTPSEGGSRGGGGGFSDRGDRGGFGGGFRDRDGPPRREREPMDEGPSRADTEDWGTRRAPPPAFDDDRRGGGFRSERPGGGGGYRRGSPERGDPREPSRADVEDRWERKPDNRPTAFEERPRRGGGGFDDSGPPRGGGDSRWGGGRGDGAGGDRGGDNWKREGTPPSGGDDAGPKERPKLQLAPRTAATTDAPSATDDGSGENGRSSIFGAARPREAVLKEQGRDALSEDAKLEQKAVPPPASKGNREEREVNPEEAELRDKILDLRSQVKAAEEGDADKEALEVELKELQEKLLKLKGPSRSGDRERRPRRDNNNNRERDNNNRERDSNSRNGEGEKGAANGKERAPRAEKPKVEKAEGAKW